MRVHLIKTRTVEEFAAKHASARKSFEEWLYKIKQADWATPQDIKKTFASADILGKGSNRAVFDVGGNNYRIICEYKFGNNYVHVFVCWIGTHAEYDKLCAEGRQYTVHDY
jgi:mRNA interferase HigB